MPTYIVNLGGPVSDRWWARCVQLGIISAGFSNAIGDKGQRLLCSIGQYDKVLMYASGFGYLGVGIAGHASSYQLKSKTDLPTGYESTQRHWRSVNWIHVIPNLNNAVKRAAAGYHSSQTVQKVGEATATSIIELIAERTAFHQPEEVSLGSIFWEGAVSTVLVSRYERDPKARQACLDHFGYKCQACDMSFEGTYGDLGKDFIHVHHLIPLSQIKNTYCIDPLSDLIPLCANCHAMVHRQNPPLTVPGLVARIRPRPPEGI